MATHPSILAWRIPWRGELGRLQPIESQTEVTEHTGSTRARTGDCNVQTGLRTRVGLNKMTG